MRRLGEGGLRDWPPGVPGPAYDRANTGRGIVHVGLGAFTRAHQAWYTDRAMEEEGGNWLITGVSLRSSAVGDQLNPQHGLYTLEERSGEGCQRRIIGSVAEVLVAARQRALVLLQLISPATHIVTFTVTEKGYCRAGDGSLDLALADTGFYPLLAEAFTRRQAAGTGGLTLLSCDNLADNGGQLARLMRAYLAARHPGLVGWFEAACTCPATMVDRIVPATTEMDRTALVAARFPRDEGLVVTEPFSQWVIEDRFAGPRPAWHRVGVQIVGDVMPYELAKLRMLNGAHSALAYLGLLRGYTYVHEAVADPALATIARRIMLEEAAPGLTPAPGQDLPLYAEALMVRFANPALQHRLIQIAMDGSQKIPQRWLATLATAQAQGRDCPALLQALAAWLRHVRGDTVARWGAVDDPRAAELAALWAQHGSKGIAAALFGADGALPSGWRPDAATLAGLQALL